MRKIIITLGVIVLLAVIVIGVGQTLMNNDNQAGNGSGMPPEQGSQGEQQAPPNPEGCPAVEVVAVPGTWESRSDDDPINPQANPNSLMLQVTRPLQDQFNESDVKVFTVPYTAQFRNINALHEMSYDDSRNQGFRRMADELAKTNQECPGTKFILTGFSQGAVISGDMANEIGNDRGPVPAESILGVALIADGRMEKTRGELVGNKEVMGQGAELALQPVNGLVQGVVPGATMRGARPNGFNKLDDRVLNFCAKEDLVCDAPLGIGDALARAQELVAANAVHAQYATNDAVVPGQTVPQWIVGWASDRIRENIS